MLSKAQARAFFVVATLGFSGVFLGLTIDTVRQVPARSHEDLLTAEVVRGKEIWEANNCMGCHTLLGEGGYYAPELTKVVDRRGEVWLRTFLRDPEAMYPGRRKMVNYHFNEEQISEVIAFFAWVGKIDTNGFPAAPDMAPKSSGPGPSATTAAAPPIFTAICVSCHSLGGKGGAVGPALDGVSSRFSTEALRAWLADPQSVKPGTTMPNLKLSDADLDALVSFLSHP